MNRERTRSTRACDHTFAERAAHAAALLASTCAIGSLLLGVGLAYAWLTDSTHLTNEITLSAPEAPQQEPYAALYADPTTQACSLVFDRGDTIAASWAKRELKASWRGMETGAGDFSQARMRPWAAWAANIDEIACSDAAQESPIHILDMRGWFQNMNALIHADVSGITPDAAAAGERAAATDLSEIFTYCPRLETIFGIDRWNMQGQERICQAFGACKSLRTISLKGWDVSTITDANSLFWDCASLSSVDITGWHMEKCTKLDSCFAQCTSLTEITGLKDLHCPSVTSIAGMFSRCKSLTAIDLSGFGTHERARLTNSRFMMEGCDSLRYLDLSGVAIDQRNAYSQDTFSNADTLETLIVSNRFRIGQAPPPARPVTDSPTLLACGFWVRDETGERFSQHALAGCIDACFDATDTFKTIRFTASSANLGPDEAYAAVYQKSDGSCALIMDVGTSAPPTRDDMHLVAEIRDFLIDGERGSALWRSYALSEVRIMTSLKPHSCRSWFFAMLNIASVQGLDLLDMTHCSDVTDMFTGIRAPQLDVEDWKLSAQVEGLRTLFYDCSGLIKLDLSRWDIEAELSLGQLFSLYDLTLPSTISLVRLDDPKTETAAAFADGHWYAEGYGSPLSSPEVCVRVNASHGTKAQPLRFIREKLDRSYAALYAGAEGNVLVFGRGLSIPDPSHYGSLLSSYRGLEEQTMTKTSWMSFQGEGCPWSASAKSILSVACDASARACPLAPQDITGWFAGMDSVKRIDALEAGAFDASQIRCAAQAFLGCSALEEVPLGFMSSFSQELSDVTAMFSGCAALASAPALPFSMCTKITNASRMFEGCSSLTELDLASWDFSSVRSCSSMFSECTSLSKIALPRAFVSPQRPAALDMAFNRCLALIEIDTRDWDLSQATSLFRTFNACQSLERIQGAESWDTATVTTMNSTFRLCRELQLDCSGWNVSAVEDSTTFALGAPGVISPFEVSATLAEKPLTDALEPNEDEASVPEPTPSTDDAPSIEYEEADTQSPEHAPTEMPEKPVQSELEQKEEDPPSPESLDTTQPGSDKGAPDQEQEQT